MVTHDPDLGARAQRNVHVLDGRVRDPEEVHSPTAQPASASPGSLRLA
jgi:hypothetical protein